MRVLIVGANGQIGRRLIEQMSSSEHRSRAMIRSLDQAEPLRKIGADETVVADLEGDVQPALEGCDAVVFAAGSGGDTGPEKTDAVDRDGAIAIMDASRRAGVERFVMVSSMGADTPEKGPENLQHYLKAKGAADAHLRESGLSYTIVRPGSLTNDKGTGHIAVAGKLEKRGSVSRDDVAAVLLHALDSTATRNRQFEMLTGNTAVPQALAAL